MPAETAPAIRSKRRPSSSGAIVTSRTVPLPRATRSSSSATDPGAARGLVVPSPSNGRSTALQVGIRARRPLGLPGSHVRVCRIPALGSPRAPFPNRGRHLRPLPGVPRGCRTRSSRAERLCHGLAWNRAMFLTEASTSSCGRAVHLGAATTMDVYVDKTGGDQHVAEVDRGCGCWGGIRCRPR